MYTVSQKTDPVTFWHNFINTVLMSIMLGSRLVVVEIFVHGAVKATVTNAPQSQLNK